MLDNIVVVEVTIKAAIVLTSIIFAVFLRSHINNLRYPSRDCPDNNEVRVACDERPKKAVDCDNTNPFDYLADTYDSTFCDTAVGRMLRCQTWHVLEAAFAPPARGSTTTTTKPVFEISCGTGEDAWWLASKNVHVVATDYSDRMLTIARSKCNNDRPTAVLFSTIPKAYHPTFQTFDASQNLNKLSSNLFPARKYSGAFSNFGGLNNIAPESIVRLAEALARSLLPGAKVVLVVMGRFCLMETAYYLLLKGKYHRAFRRWKSNPTVGICAKVGKKNNHMIYFHSLKFIQETFHNTKAFRSTKIRAIGLFLPPSLWSKSASRKIPTSILQLLGIVDAQLGQLWPFVYLGDHYLIEFERVEEDVDEDVCR